MKFESIGLKCPDCGNEEFNGSNCVSCGYFFEDASEIGYRSPDTPIYMVKENPASISEVLNFSNGSLMGNLDSNDNIRTSGTYEYLIGETEGSIKSFIPGYAGEVTIDYSIITNNSFRSSGEDILPIVDLKLRLTDSKGSELKFGEGIASKLKDLVKGVFYGDN